MENLNQPINLTGIDKYYQEEFTKIQDSNGSYKGKWNWWAFFFTWIWCFTKSCWLFGIITMLAFSITFYQLQLTPGVHINFGFSSNIIWCLLLGWRGTWIYYNVKMLKKQFPSF